jgi:ribonucleoside-diphosphate reductase alpha chain
MNNTLPTDYQNFIAVSRYARWIEEENRRETWEETVGRYVDYISTKVKGQLPISELKDAIVNLEVMPSMRALMTAGPALERDNTAGYNCSYMPVDDPKSFDEAMYILLCGTGVGFSVERKYIEKLPDIPQNMEKCDTIILVQDSKEGWAKALRRLIGHLYMGEIPEWNMSQIRPAGARLKIFGGRASGPAPLVDLFNFTVSLFKHNAGRKLSSYDCHNLMCKVGEVVVSGGVRRSAMISLSNLSDGRMRHAKSGKWWESAPQMALANNSVCYTDKPDGETFLREWLSLVESKSGERGIFNRTSAKVQASKYGRRNPDYDFGTNPCSEIILRPYQFCNLTEVVIRESDKFEDLARKVKFATILGTAQATLTKFPYLRKIWKDNTEEERLLGVSLTGIMDNELTSGQKHGLENTLKKLREIAVDTNKEWAGIFGIPQSTAITCVKPSGTVSQLVDSSSGIHPRHSAYYIRTVRGDNKDPLVEFLKDSGVPNEPDFMKPDGQTVFSFPMKSPDTSLLRDDMTAIEQLETWLTYQRYWCEHKPSVTVSVRDDEWMEVGAFVFEHFDEMSGVSFLPHSDHTYQQAPYQDCTYEVYQDFSSKFVHINWDKFQDYEKEDTTSGSQTFACSGDSCEMVDIGA